MLHFGFGKNTEMRKTKKNDEEGTNVLLLSKTEKKKKIITSLILNILKFTNLLDTIYKVSILPQLKNLMTKFLI